MSKTKSVLGKGLGALIPGAAHTYEEETSREHAEHEAPEVHHESTPEIPIDKIRPNSQQPRKDFSSGSMNELVASIKEHGVIQAITVRKLQEGNFELVSGERRWRAARAAGLTSIPAFILGVEGNTKMLEMAIIENVQRKDLNPIEEAEAYERLIRECSLTQDEVAEKIAKDRTTISNFLRLLRLPEPIRMSLRKGELGIGHAKAVLGISEPEKQELLWNRAVREQLSVRKLEELARESSRDKLPVGNPKGNARSKASSNGHVSGAGAIEDQLKQSFGTQVKVRMKPDRTGEISLQFYSDEDLERIIDLLLSQKSD